MMAHPIQIILTRQLAEYLSVPLFLVDSEGNLLYYNEPAEKLLGRRFDETGGLSLEAWWSIFSRFDEAGVPICREDHPLMVTLAEKRPTSKRYRIGTTDGTIRRIEATTVPITGLQGELFGAVALFWELSE